MVCSLVVVGMTVPARGAASSADAPRVVAAVGGVLLSLSTMMPPLGAAALLGAISAHVASATASVTSATAVAAIPTAEGQWKALPFVGARNSPRRAGNAWIKHRRAALRSC